MVSVETDETRELTVGSRLSYRYVPAIVRQSWVRILGLQEYSVSQYRLNYFILIIEKLQFKFNNLLFLSLSCPCSTYTSLQQVRFF